MTRMAGYGWLFVEMAGNGWKWLEMARNGWNGWILLERPGIGGHGLKWDGPVTVLGI